MWIFNRKNRTDGPVRFNFQNNHPFILEEILFTVGRASPTAMPLIYEMIKKDRPGEEGRIADTDPALLRIYPSLIGQAGYREAVKADLAIIRQALMRTGEEERLFFSHVDFVPAKAEERPPYMAYPPENFIVFAIDPQIREVLRRDEEFQKEREDMRRDYFERARTRTVQAAERFKALPYMDRREKLMEEGMVVFDLNTTGTTPERNEIIQFSAVDLQGNVLYNQRFKPEFVKKWPRSAVRANGLIYEDLQDEPSLIECLPIIQRLFRNCQTVSGFYIDRFDLNFLIQAGIEFPENLFVCDEREAAPSLERYAKEQGYSFSDKTDSLDRARAVAFGLRKRYQIC